MLSEINLTLSDFPNFKEKALAWASEFSTACYFDSNHFADQYSAFDVLIAAGESEKVSSLTGKAFDELQALLDAHKSSWILGFLGYDLKNELEALASANQDHLNFPDLYFFVPKHLILIKGDNVKILSEQPELILNTIKGQPLTSAQSTLNAEIKSRFTYQEYLSAVQQLRQHILRGDIYEINFCQEFFCEDLSINPLQIFNDLNGISPTPFSTFLKFDNRYLLSATPERFLSKKGSKVISQPIKGTARRSKDRNEDISIKQTLKLDEKEQAENVMIVDLVRNDLTKFAIPGSVRVEELFGIYSFEQVHQMISTVVCEVDQNCSATEIIKSAFPMGSMTGAPKVSAMTLIEKYEKSKRGAFSGAAGYFAPNGDFDFNVVIRTLLYNADNKYLSYQAGSAITFSSNPEKEYQECLLKAEAIRQVLNKKERD